MVGRVIYCVVLVVVLTVGGKVDGRFVVYLPNSVSNDPASYS